jgi:hypothetical protein
VTCCGLTQMIGADGESHPEVLVTPLGKTSLKHLTITTVSLSLVSHSLGLSCQEKCSRLFLSVQHEHISCESHVLQSTIIHVSDA